jgi:hypothetical protein
MTDRVPKQGEPDPDNYRFRPFQGGTDGLSEPPTHFPSYGEMKYGDDHGPAGDLVVENGGASSGLSGLPQANSGQVPARFNDPDTPQGDARA